MKKWTDELPDLPSLFDALGLAHKGKRVECPHCRDRHSDGRLTAFLWSNGDGFTCRKCGASGRAADAVSWLTYGERADFGDDDKRNRLRDECAALGLIDGSWRERRPLPPLEPVYRRKARPAVDLIGLCTATPHDPDTVYQWAKNRGLPEDIAAHVAKLPDIYVVNPDRQPRGVSSKDHVIWFGLRGADGGLNDAARRPVAYSGVGPKELPISMALTGRESGSLRTFGHRLTDVGPNDAVLILEAPADAAVALAGVHALGLPFKVMSPPGSGEVPKLAKALAERGVSRVILGLDNDDAGRKAEAAVLASIAGQCFIDGLKIPEGLDLTDVARGSAEGLPILRALLTDFRHLDYGPCPDAAHTLDANLGPYLQPLSEYPEVDNPVVVIAADLGSGKTHQITERAEDRGIVYLSHRRGLSRAGAERMGLKCYEDITGTIRDTRVSVCVNSAHRIRGNWAAQAKLRHSMKPPVLVIDESESVASALFNGTIPSGQSDERADNGTILECLRHLALSVIAEGGQVFFADANAGPLTTKLAQFLTSERPIGTIEHRRPMTGHTVKTYSSQAAALGAVDDAVSAGQRVCVAVTSKELAGSLEAQFASNGVKVKAYTGDMSDADRASLGNPVTAWADYQVVIFNTACDAGVSYDASVAGVPAFDRMFLIANQIPNATLGLDTLLQMSARVRGMTTVESWIAPQLTHNRACDLASIEDEKLTTANASERVACRARTHIEGGKIIYRPTDEAIFTLALHVEQWRRLRGRKVSEQWELWWKARGATVEHIPESGNGARFAAALKEAGEVRGQRQVEAVLAAEPVAHERPDGFLELAQAERARLEHTFGPECVDAELIETDRTGDASRKAKRVARLVLAHKAHSGDELAFRRLAESDVRALNTGHRANAKATAHTAQAYHSLLCAAFGEAQVDALLAPPDTEPPALKWPEGEDAVLVIDRYFTRLRGQGIDPKVMRGTDLDPKTIRGRELNTIIGSILRVHGFKTDKKQRRGPDGQRFRSYRLNPESWQQTMTRAAATVTRHLGFGPNFTVPDGRWWATATTPDGWAEAMPVEQAPEPQWRKSAAHRKATAGRAANRPGIRLSGCHTLASEDILIAGCVTAPSSESRVG